ncbi:hypothetical protein ACFL1B_00225 [Nanoarchaeota archaeon]
MTKEKKLDREVLLSELVETLLQKYDLSYSDFEDIIKKKKEVIKLPVSVFRNKLSPLESIVKYLRENKGLKYKEIGDMLGRDPRVIGVTYTRAKKKVPDMLPERKSKYDVPIDLFKDKTLSVAENLVMYLLSRGLRLHEIAVIMKRDDRTIWTVQARSKLKIQKKP